MRRRIRREFTWLNSAWVQTNEVRYVYDGNLVIQERWFYTNISTAIPARSVTYSRGLDLAENSWIAGLRHRSEAVAGGIGGLLARTESGLSTINSSLSTSFYQADGNGNVTCLINTNQIVVAKYMYDPFGNFLSRSGPAAEANLYRFSSKESHVNSGLVCYLYRYYEPNLQRWISRDPLGVRGGVNTYSHVRNRLPNYVDPQGLCDWGKVRSGSIAVGGSIVAAVGLIAAEAPSAGLVTFAAPTVFFGLTHGLLEIGSGIKDDPNDETTENFLCAWPSNAGGGVGYLIAVGMGLPGGDGTQVGNAFGAAANAFGAQWGLFYAGGGGESIGLPLAEVAATQLEGMAQAQGAAAYFKFKSPDKAQASTQEINDPDNLHNFDICP